MFLVGSVALFGARYVPARVLPLRPDTWAMATAFTDFAGPGCLVAAVLALGALVLHRGPTGAVLTVLCVGATATQALVLAPRWTSSPVPEEPGSLTVLALNSRLGHADPAVLARTARAADVLVLTEATAPQVQALVAAGLGDRFPYRNAGRLPQHGAHGTAVFSRFPITGTEQLTPDLDNQSWVCGVDLPGLGPSLTVVAVHPTRPRRGADRWLGEQQSLRAALPTSGPRILAGDFNAVASHPTQRALTAAGWRSSVEEAGAGWLPTYPAGSSRLPPLIDIDHVLVAGGLRSTRAASVRVPGTDHLGLLVTVRTTTG